MAMGRGGWIGIILGGLGTLVGIGVPLFSLRYRGAPRDPALAGRPLEAALDSRGPYLILATEQAARSWGEVLAEARRLHPEARSETFDPTDLAALLPRLRAAQPRYALLVMRPEELDVNFAWAWLRLSTELDADPFVDVRTGFLTGATPQEGLALLRRIAATARGELKVPARFVDQLGPNPGAPKGSFHRTPGSFMIPVLQVRCATETLSHGLEGFTRERLPALEGAGLVHYGGHGYPDRVVDSLNGPFVRRIRFAPGVFFNGACYTGVVHGWYDRVRGHWARKTVEASQSFALGVLASGTVGYLAALHPDHGIPVYQEMEHLAYRGGSLGDLIKGTHDGVVLGAGGRLPDLGPLVEGAPAPRWSPAEVMLKGTAARILYGDPALRLLDPFTEAPFTVTVRDQGQGRAAVEAILQNPVLKSTFTQTYFSDQSATGQFNDRALIACPLPGPATRVRRLEGLRVEAGGRDLPARLVGCAVEMDGGRATLHVLLDLPSTGYQEGPLRVKGARITFTAELD